MMEATLKKRATQKAEPVVTAEDSNHPLAKCKPRGDRVVVRRDIAKKVTGGGILLPDSFSNSKQQTGVVWAVGPGRYENGVLVPMDIKRGDRVIITGYAGLEIKDPLNTTSADEEFVMLREEDVLATL